MHATPADNLSELEKLEPLLQRSLRAGGRSFRFPAELERIYRLFVFPSRRRRYAALATLALVCYNLFIVCDWFILPDIFVIAVIVRLLVVTPAILAGILTQLSLYSINLKIMGKANQAINVDKYNLLISLRWVKEFALHNPIVMIIIVTAVLIGVLYWFFGTELGCAIRATGSNPAMSRAQGINTNFNIVLGLAVSNGLVALSGALLSQYQGFADVGMGRGAIVIGLAAVIIGEALFSRIFHNFALKMVSVSLGAIIYYIVIQLVLTLGFDANLLKLLSASVVAVFLAVPYWKGKYFSKPVKKAKEDAKNA